MGRKESLAERKARLIAESTELREQLSLQAHELQKVPGMVKRGVTLSNGYRIVREHPVYTALAVAAVVILRPRRIIAMAVAGAMMYKTWQRLSPFAKPVLGFLLKRFKH